MIRKRIPDELKRFFIFIATLVLSFKFDTYTFNEKYPYIILTIVIIILYRHTRIYNLLNSKGRLYLHSIDDEVKNKRLKILGTILLFISPVVNFIDLSMYFNDDIKFMIVFAAFSLGVMYIILGYFHLQRKEFVFYKDSMIILNNSKVICEIYFIKNYFVTRNKIEIVMQNKTVEIGRLDLTYEEIRDVESELHKIKSRLDIIDDTINTRRSHYKNRVQELKKYFGLNFKNKV